MISSFDHNALWDKARVFLNRAMDDSDERAFDEQAFWASAALELLGKAALSKHSPALIADPSGNDGRAILVAAGLVQGEGQFVSVAAKTVFARCAMAFRPFNSKEALTIANSRNEYVHGAGIGFVNLPPVAWWPRFFAQAVILVEALGHTVGDLVGDDRVAVVEEHLEQNSRNIEERVESLLERAKRNLALFEAGQMSGPMEREWRAPRNLQIFFSYNTSTTCPACGALGRLEADEYDNVEYDYDYDEDGRPVSRWADARALADYFSCARCQLVLDRYELIVEAGLPDTFEITIDDPDPEPDYGND